jgi:hypothetical protein
LHIHNEKSQNQLEMEDSITYPDILQQDLAPHTELKVPRKTILYKEIEAFSISLKGVMNSQDKRTRRIQRQYLLGLNHFRASKWEIRPTSGGIRLSVNMRNCSEEGHTRLVL